MLIKFNSPRLLGFKDKLIIPGLNDLADDFVAEMMEDPILQDKFDSGQLEVLDKVDLGVKKLKVKKGEEPSAVDLLLASGDKVALGLVEQTVDQKILTNWTAKETRSPVLKALKKQLAKIQNIKYRDDEKQSKLGKSDSSSDEE